MSQYHWNGTDQRFYTTKPSPDRKNETEVIQTPSGPGRWNTSAVAIASCLDKNVAERIAVLLGQHGVRTK